MDQQTTMGHRPVGLLDAGSGTVFPGTACVGKAENAGIWNAGSADRHIRSFNAWSPVSGGGYKIWFHSKESVIADNFLTLGTDLRTAAKVDSLIACNAVPKTSGVGFSCRS